MYGIEKIDTGEIIRRFGALPEAFEIVENGHSRRIISPVKVGDEGLGHRMVEIVEADFARPGQFFHQGSDVVTRNGNTVTITRQWTPWTQAEIDTFESARLDDIATQIAAVDDPIRAALLVILDEFNRHSTVHRNILAAAAAATNLADFKTRMGQIQGIAARRPSDLLNAIRQKLESPQ